MKNIVIKNEVIELANRLVQVTEGASRRDALDAMSMATTFLIRNRDSQPSHQVEPDPRSCGSNQAHAWRFACHQCVLNRR
jgi:hypothetical protein